MREFAPRGSTSRPQRYSSFVPCERRYAGQGPGVRAEELAAGFVEYMVPGGTGELVFQRIEDSDAFERKTGQVARQVGWTVAAGEARRCSNWSMCAARSG